MSRQRRSSSSSSGNGYRSVNIKRGTKIRRQTDNNNVVILKLADPIVQCGIFIYFLYCLDSDVQEPSYRTILLLLVAWQIMSSFANFFYRDTKALRTERLVYMAVNFCYMAMFFFLEKPLARKEISFGINELDQPYIHLYQTLMMSGIVVIAFWYNVICYREVKSLMSGISKDR